MSGSVAATVRTGRAGALGAALSLGLSLGLNLGLAAQARAVELLGQPTPGGIGLQPSGDKLRESAAFFHNGILMPIITAISLFVLALLAYVAVKFNRRTNPTPARWSHNTPVEILWTVMPVLILMFIAIFSFRLLFAYHDTPKADLTVKVTGNQWYWSYEYPDKGGIAFDSNILREDKAKARGVPYKLAVDNPMVVPVGANVKVLITGADVLHAFFVPAFGIQNTAVPGRVNETWFRAEKTGVYYGQCNELCGVDHAFMPIQVDVKTPADFAAWVAGHAKKPTTVATVPSPAAGPVGAPAAAGAPQGAPASPAADAVPAVTKTSTPSRTTPAAVRG